MSKVKSDKVVSVKSVPASRRPTKRARWPSLRSMSNDARVDNVLALLDEHVASHQDRDELGNTIRILLDEVDWTFVEPGTIKAVLRLLLESLPPEERAAISDRADAEREILRAVVTGRDRDAQLIRTEREAQSIDMEKKLQDVSDSAARERAASRTRPREKLDDGLEDFDLDLIGWVALACQKHRSHDFVQGVFAMPAVARRKLDDILAKINGCHVVGGEDAMDPAERYRFIAELHDVVRRNGGTASLADAFVLPHKEWQRKYVVGANCSAEREDDMR